MSARHVLIYGPPAAGKFTVAQALAARFDVGVLDNHIAVDAALRLFAFGDPGFFPLVEAIRVAMLEAAAAARLDVVSTFVYGHPHDQEAMERLLAPSRRHGGDVTVVQLLPSADETRRRVATGRRLASNKISDLDVFDEYVGRHDVRSPYPGTDLTIDNTHLTAEDVAERLGALVGFRRRVQEPA